MESWGEKRRGRLLRKANVLFVDDLPESVKEVTIRLAQEGVTVKVVKTDIQARRVLERTVPDLVVVDVRLKGEDDKSGLALAMEFSKRFAVVLMSGYLEKTGITLSEMNALRSGLGLVLDKGDSKESVLRIERRLTELRNGYGMARRRWWLGLAAGALTAGALSASVISSLAPTRESLVALAALAAGGLVLTFFWLQAMARSGSQHLRATDR